jgi:hypothetical protein
MPTMPRSAAELFDQMIPAGLRQSPDKAREVNCIYAFKINGDGGGEWTCDLTANPPNCVRGVSDRAQCTMEVNHEDFKSMLSDPNAGMQLYFQGRLRMSGDPMLAMKMQELFRLAQSD